MQDKSLVPKRTIQVLKDDRTWFQTEAKTKL
jgi:hypothetical protein